MCLRDFENLRVARISLFNRRFERLGWATTRTRSVAAETVGRKNLHASGVPLALSPCRLPCPGNPYRRVCRTCGPTVRETIRMPLSKPFCANYLWS